MSTSDYTREFVSFKPELQSFLYRLLINKQDVEDITQETYLKIHQHINSFKGESSFKTWVFSIAMNLSKNHLARQKRWRENGQDYGAALHAVDHELWVKMRDVFAQTPDRIYEIKEHINYCFNCINKTLETNQQVCLLLKEVYHFKVAEIVEVTGLTEGVVKHAIADARKHMIRIFDNRCSFVSKKGVCHQCSVLKGNLNPKQDAQQEALKLQMVKDGENPDKDHLLNLRLELVKEINPLEAPNSVLNTYMLENHVKWVEDGTKQKVLGSHSDSVVEGCQLN